MTGLIRKLYVSLRTACQARRSRLPFRDPATDFGVSVTRPDALTAMQPYRRLPGPYLLEHGHYLYLYLGNSTADGMHAIMDCTAPDDLVFSYTQIMASFPRFRGTPGTIGLIGLGGGSLLKHCYRAFPLSRIVVAEISPEVIALRRNFLLPEDDDRCSVRQVDGAALLEDLSQSWDVLLIDAFDENGYLPHFATVGFYRDCFRALSGNGVLVVNFSGEQWRRWFHRLDRVFRRHTVLYQCPDGDNVIAFATKGPLPDFTH